ADSVAYDTHDADDALQLGLLSLDDLAETALWREAIGRVRARYAGLAGPELRRAVLHELIDWQVGDLLAQSWARIEQSGVSSVADVRRAPLVVRANAELGEKKAELERFLHQRVYRHPQVLVQRDLAQGELRELFAGYLALPQLMPERFRQRVAEHGLERTVADYLAGMTDRFARSEYARLFAA
ncbi:MAG TPA: metal-dependent phosphohydrolase, partial [Pirellulales bacterium]|nr:metal-dependent phosphohydrolase [Pirellulales bacterium]